MGIAFFWTIAGIAQIYIDQLADEAGSLFEYERTPLLFCVTLGIGIGSVLAGIISAGKIELGLVPWGAMGIALFSMLMIFSPTYFMLETAGFLENDDRRIAYCRESESVLDFLMFHWHPTCNRKVPLKKEDPFCQRPTFYFFYAC